MQCMSSSEITKLAKALIEVQKLLTPAMKDARNPFTKSTYATLNSVMDTCRDALLQNGIWLCQYLVPVDATGCIGLATKLTHAESGQWQSSIAVVPLPKADPQGMGSAITYARRYALSAMLGIVTEDDDGEAAKISQKSSSHSKRAINVPQTQKSQNRNPSHGNSQFGASEGQPGAFESLPKLEGIVYQIVTAKDGRACIVATGNTQARKEILTDVGFKWNPQRKIWWMYTDAA